jgi:hypothetical protein
MIRLRGIFFNIKPGGFARVRREYRSLQKNQAEISEKSGKRALSAKLHSVAVLRSERGKRLEVRGGRRNVKCQSSNAKRENPNDK